MLALTVVMGGTSKRAFGVALLLTREGVTMAALCHGACA